MAYTHIRNPITGALREDMILRDDDGATICAGPDNPDWQAYEAWRDEGNTPADPPATPPSVPAVISDRQFAQALALAGTITQDEALAWAAKGELPEAMQDALAHIPEAGGQRFSAHMLLAAATTYERHHPLTDQLGALLANPVTGKPYDAGALDALWTRAAAL